MRPFSCPVSYRAKKFCVNNSKNRSLDNVEAEEVGDPFRVALICLFSFDGFHIFGVCEDDMHMRFQDIKNRNPIFTGGFRADIAAVLCEKPAAQGGDIGMGGVKDFGFVRGRQSG